MVTDNVFEDLLGSVSLADEGEGDSTFEYWADKSAPDLVNEVLERKEDGERLFERTSIFNKAFRSLRYAFGFFDGQQDWGDTAISVVGEQGQILDFTSNMYRSLMVQLITMVTGEPPGFEAAPANTSTRARVQSRNAERIFDFYLRKRRFLEEARTGFEKSMIYGTGFLYATWDPQRGASVLDPAGEDEVHEGDVRIVSKDLLDVIWDFNEQESEDDMIWIAVRSWVNRANLIARFPEHSSEIERAEARRLDEYDTSSPETAKDSDSMAVWEFYHLPTDALPSGRYTLFVDDEAVLVDTDFPYRRLPVKLLRPKKIPRTLLGWSPLFDIQKQQELLNEILGKLATIYDNLGLPILWTKSGTKQPSPSQWIGNIAWLESEEPPQQVTLTEVPDGAFRMIEFLVVDMQRRVGLNEASMGETAGSVRANNMQTFLEEQTLRFMNDLSELWKEAIEWMGTMTLEILQDFQFSPKLAEVVGRQNAEGLLTYSPGDLYDVTSITIKQSPRILQTASGKLEFLKVLADMGVSLPKEEVISVLQGEPLEAILGIQQGQMDLARAENDAILDGSAEHRAVATDNHLYHIKKHSELLNSPHARNDPALFENALAALMEHLTLYNDPSVFFFQMALGYAEIPPLLGGAGGESAGGAPGSPTEAGTQLPEGAQGAEALPPPGAPPIEAPVGAPA